VATDHSPQNFCTNWIFAGEGSTNVGSNNLHCIGIGDSGVASTGCSTHQQGRQMDFSKSWGNNDFLHGVAEKKFPRGQQW